MNAHPERDTAADELIFTTDETGIARIVLNRPQARNALTFAMYRGLIASCEAIAAAARPRRTGVLISGDATHRLCTQYRTKVMLLTAQPCIAARCGLSYTD